MHSSSLSLPSLPTPSKIPNPKPKKPKFKPPPSPIPIPNLTTPSQLQQIHAHFIKFSIPITTLPFSVIAEISALSSPSQFLYARQLFLRNLPHSETFLWNTHLHSLASSQSPSDAISLLIRLLQNSVPLDTFTLSYSLKACSLVTAPAVAVGRAVHALVQKFGFQTDAFLLNTLVHMYASCGRFEDARFMFDRIPVRDVVTWNIMITNYSKREDGIGIARELFDEMPERSVRSWTAMIAGYVKWGNPREGVRLFREMEGSGFEVNDVTVVAVVAACADIGELELGRRMHEYAGRSGFLENVRVCNTLIDMYIKCGCVDRARKLFDGMRERSVVTWSAMIGGHAMHGQGEEALRLFRKMVEANVRPNGVTFVGLLHACSHMGLLEEGRGFFASMEQEYGIEPRIEHYGCMVDLLSRNGLLEEALDFIRNMPIEPNSVVWGALLGGARLHKSVEMGEEAIRHLVKLDPLNDGYYVVLSNIYAEAGQWKNVGRIRRLMKGQGVKKTPGASTIALDGVIHEFVAGESDHPDIQEVYERWDELLVELKQRGYVPDKSVVLLDMEEGEKEQVLFRHSEKLAVVYGLMRTPPGTPIRIIKNLRVCNDCHAVMKLMSEISGREIIVRDRNRFHSFNHGSCSCKDYW